MEKKLILLIGFIIILFGFFQAHQAFADSDNLLVNPGAEAGDSATGWTITANGGNGWNMSTNWDGQIHSGSRVFRTSYGWGVMEQTVDLSTAPGANLSTKPDIEFSDWVNSRCNGSYYLTYKILDSGHNEIASYNYGTSGSPLSISGSGDNSTWIEKAYTFTGYGTEPKYAYIQQAGVSSCMWAGYYGPHFDDASVIIQYASVSTVTLSAATDKTTAAATLNGNITATGGDNPVVTVYWGTTDHAGTTAGWDHSAVLGSQGVAGFEKSLESLSPGTTYYFTASATNSAGTSWPAASLNFTTNLPDLSGAPVFTAGTPAKFGSSLTVGAGTLNPSTHLTYTWYRSSDDQVGGDTQLGTGTTYTPVTDDIGNYLIVVVASTDANGSGNIATTAAVINAGTSASLDTDDGNANLAAPDGFALGNITLHIAKTDGSSASDIPASIFLVGDNYFQLTATNQDGNSAGSFSQPVTFTVSYGTNTESQYEESTLDVYKDENGAWTKKNCNLDTAANTLTCSLSSFSVYGVLGEKIPADTNSNDNAAENTNEDPAENTNDNIDPAPSVAYHKAHITSWKAYRYEDPNKSCESRLKLIIRGRHFGKDTQVKIGRKLASSVDVAYSRKIVAKYCLDKLLKAQVDDNRKITVKNLGTSADKASKRLDLDEVEKKD